VEADGDAVAVAKALADSARDTKVLEIRGGVMQGRVISGADVESLAKLPPLDVLRGQVIGAILAPLSAIAALVNAPLQNLYGLIDARIEQLEAANPAAPDSLVGEPAAEVPTTDDPLADQPKADQPQEENE
jgi:ribosomal protein L10